MGCAHSGAAPSRAFDREAWEGAVRRLGLAPERVVYPFEGSPELAEWVERTLEPERGRGAAERLEALQRALFDKDFHFVYANDVTLTAAEAFRERRGNCMSFTALFVAMARTAGIPAFLMSVRRVPEVDRDGSLVVVNRHVVAGYRSVDRVYVYDFYISSSEPFIQQFVVNDVEASALYHNNLGGSAMRRGDLDDALRHLAITTALAPHWATGWVNLGVARFQLHDTEGALDAYERALSIDAGNPSALTNLAHLYRRLGMPGAADGALRAAAERTTNPFTLIATADVELLRGNPDSAAAYLRKARRWYGDEPAVWEAMARLASRRGDPRGAARCEARADALRGKSAAREDS